VGGLYWISGDPVVTVGAFGRLAGKWTKKPALRLACRDVLHVFLRRSAWLCVLPAPCCGVVTPVYRLYDSLAYQLKGTVAVLLKADTVAM
jgi:hypothetical protein